MRCSRRGQPDSEGASLCSARGGRLLASRAALGDERTRGPALFADPTGSMEALLSHGPSGARRIHVLREGRRARTAAGAAAEASRRTEPRRARIGEDRRHRALAAAPRRA